MHSACRYYHNKYTCTFTYNHANLRKTIIFSLINMEVMKLHIMNVIIFLDFWVEFTITLVGQGPIDHSNSRIRPAFGLSISQTAVTTCTSCKMINDHAAFNSNCYINGFVDTLVTNTKSVPFRSQSNEFQICNKYCSSIPALLSYRICVSTNVSGLNT